MFHFPLCLIHVHTVQVDIFRQKDVICEKTGNGGSDFMPGRLTRTRLVLLRQLCKLNVFSKMRFYKWPKEGRSVFVPASTHVRPGITDPHARLPSKAAVAAGARRDAFAGARPGSPVGRSLTRDRGRLGQTPGTPGCPSPCRSDGGSRSTAANRCCTKAGPWGGRHHPFKCPSW